MPKGTQLFENTLAGLAALAIVLVCTSSLQGQAGFVLKSTATEETLEPGSRTLNLRGSWTGTVSTSGPDLGSGEYYDAMVTFTQTANSVRV